MHHLVCFHELSIMITVVYAEEYSFKYQLYDNTLIPFNLDFYNTKTYGFF